LLDPDFAQPGLSKSGLSMTSQTGPECVRARCVEQQQQHKLVVPPWGDREETELN